MEQECAVQILLASYNGARYIAQQIDSILRQTYPGCILTIRDDGSTDETPEIIRHYVNKYPDRLRFLEDERTKGGASMNFGRLLEKVEGDYYMLCDQDDVWMEDKVSRSLEALRRLERAWGRDIPLLVFSDLTITDEHLRILHPSFWKLRKLDPSMAVSYEQLIANNVVTGCTTLFNRAARDAALPIPYRRFLHDQWIAFHVAYYGKLDYIQEPTLYYRQHGRNEMGARTLSASYFLGKISFFPRLWSDWRWLKAQRTIPFRLGRTVRLKLAFNLKRFMSLPLNNS